MENNSRGVSVLTVLQIIFIVLKLTSVVHWRWLVVFLPYEIELVLVVITVLWYYLRELFDRWFNG